MREVVIQVWCDQHAASSDEATLPVQASHQLTMGLDTDTPLRLDLCAECWDTLVAPLAKTLADFGTKPDAPAAPPRKSAAAPKAPQHNDPGDCPVCGQFYQWLSTHVTNVHGVEAPADSVCPICGEQCGNATHLGRHFQDEHGQRMKWWLAEQQAKAAKRPRRSRTKSET